MIKRVSSVISHTLASSATSYDCTIGKAKLANSSSDKVPSSAWTGLTEIEKPNKATKNKLTNFRTSIFPFFFYICQSSNKEQKSAGTRIPPKQEHPNFPTPNRISHMKAISNIMVALQNKHVNRIHFLFLGKSPCISYTPRPANFAVPAISTRQSPQPYSIL